MTTEQIDVLAWLDSLHATTAAGAVSNEKWPEAQQARAAVAELVEAARYAQCACTPKERYSGHQVDCWMPYLRAAIAAATGEQE